MKRLSEISIIINYSLIFVLIFVIGAVISQILTINKLSNGLYSANATSFTLTSDRNMQIDFNMLYSALENNTVLYKELELNHDYRAIAFKGNVAPPPMIEGRYFTESDFIEDKNCAVVGKKALPLTHEVGEERFIYFDGKEYLVVGVMGTERASGMDYSVFININTVERFQNTYGLYFLDSNKSGVVESINNLQENGLLLTFIEHTNISPLDLVTNYSSELNVIGMIAISLLASSIALINAWMLDNKDQIIVRRLCGFTHNMIFKDYMKKYLINLGISILIALPFIILVQIYFQFSLLFVLPACILLFCVSALASTILFRRNYNNILLEAKKL